MKAARRIALTIAIIAVAILFLAASMKKLSLKLHRDGQRRVGIEVVHTPNAQVRWIYVEGIIESEDAILYTSQSASEVEGDKCPIVHRISWRNIPEGILKVEVRLRDVDNKDIEFTVGHIIVR